MLTGLRWALLALVAGAACRTAAPDEHYFDGKAASSVGGTGSNGGRSSAGVGSGPNGGAASGSGAGGDVGVAGAADAGDSSTSSGGEDAGGAPDVEPPDPPEVALLECGAAPVSDAAFTRESLRAAAAECASWHFCNFENAAATLEARVRAYASETSTVRLADAQAAWREAMALWSRIELFQFGPLASRSQSAGKDVFGGQGLRDPIYGWPSVARCRVEDQIASQAFRDAGLDRVLTSGRGLYAIEYSLFYHGVDSACSGGSSTAETFAQLSEDELAARKREYATTIAADVLERARALSGAYRAEDSDFKQRFVSASGYPSEQEAMNVLGWAIFYVEREVKDWKLGVPAGYTLTHPVGEPEAPFAGTGTDNLRNNLLGFRSLFEGCGPDGEGLGLDDWLVEAGHAELSSDILAAWRGALSAVEEFPPYAEADQDDFRALHAELKVLTDLLKSELLGAGSPLNLKLPDSLASDTD